MKQQTFASQSSFEKYGRKSRGSCFWMRWKRLFHGPSYKLWTSPTTRRRASRRPVGLAIMLRTYFMQQWFNLSDPGVEEAFYESPTLRAVRRRGPGRGSGTGRNDRAALPSPARKAWPRRAMLDTVNQHLAAKGIRIETGTIVDATIIHAPSSTRNAKKERDPAMRQTRKGKQWYFGLKAHIGVDAKEGHVHSVATSAANVSDIHMLPDLLHGEERKVWGDGGYQGQTKAIQQAAPKAQDMTCRRTSSRTMSTKRQRRKIRRNQK